MPRWLKYSSGIAIAITALIVAIRTLVAGAKDIEPYIPTTRGAFRAHATWSESEFQTMHAEIGSVKIDVVEVRAKIKAIEETNARGIEVQEQTLCVVSRRKAKKLGIKCK